MKILQLIQKPQLRGAEMFASQLSDQLLALGHECKMVTLFAGHATLTFSGEFIYLNRGCQYQVSSLLVKEVSRRFMVAAGYLTLALTFNFLLSAS